MALRNQLLVKGMAEKIAALKLDEKEMETVADVCLARRAKMRRRFCAVFVGCEGRAKNAAKYLEHAINIYSFNDLDSLVKTARARLGGDESQQLALLKSIQDGAARRGIALSANVRSWATELIGKVLSAEVPVTEPAWAAVTLDDKPNEANPWVVQNRASADGKTDAFLCSLPLGETLTGIYRSASFDLPAKLSFYMAGHNGLPPKVHPPKNFIRLRDAKTNDLLMEAIPAAQRYGSKIRLGSGEIRGKEGRDRTGRWRHGGCVCVASRWAV
jgi:hypothetical protein